MRPIICKFLKLQDYLSTLIAMQNFTKHRDLNTNDEIWFLEHPAVFTLGKVSLEHHILNAGDIPVIKSDRGGQVTYHGPGQLIIYFLLDLVRGSISLKKLIYILQQSIIELLKNNYNINADLDPNAPGVYIAGEKICSIGLKIARGCSYHGLSFNVNMNLQPFSQINPCGFANLKMTQLINFNKISAKISTFDINTVAILLQDIFIIKLKNNDK